MIIILTLSLLVIGTLIYNSLGNKGFEFSLVIKDLRSQHFELGIFSFTDYREESYVHMVSFGFFLFSLEIGFHHYYEEENPS